MQRCGRKWSSSCGLIRPDGTVRYLITGTAAHNKGSELMLLAIIQQVRTFDQEPVMIIDPDCGSYEWRARLGLRQLFDPHKSGRLAWMRTRLFHAGYRQRFGLMLPEEIDVVMDASGFAFGDQWKPEWLEASAELFERYRRQGATIVLLPQAFGPFKVAGVRNAARRILAASDLVFARDPESLAHCCEICKSLESVHLAPDFTNLLDGRLPVDWQSDSGHVAVVPNRQMLARGPEQDRKHYVQLLSEGMRRAALAGYRPFMLVHERNDHEVARRIASEARMPDCIVQYENPLELKGILGTCAFSIGSRFHGLVSALSQGVPCIGTAWTHKYYQLFDNYGVREWVDAWDQGGVSWLAKLDELLIPSTQSALRERLRERSVHLLQEAKSTWAAVGDLIQCR